MTEAIDQLADFAFTTAKKIIERGEEAKPCCLIQVSPREIIPVMMLWNTQTEKESAYRFIRHALREHNAIAYAFVSETWALFDPVAAQKWATHGSGSLAQHPDRVDCLTVSAYDRNGVSRMIVAEIKTKNRKRTVCQPIPFPPQMLTAGAATDLFL